MNKEQVFLELFKRLEQHLRVEYTSERYSHSGFMSSLYKIKKSAQNPVISNNSNFDIIGQAAQIRNIIAHNTNVLVPSDRFLNQFRDIVNDICDPLKIEHIMIPFSKLKTVDLDESIGNAIMLLKTHGYNTIPVVDNGVLLGIFTEKSVFDYLSMNRFESISKNMKMKDILEAIDLNSDPRKYFDFISRHDSVHDAYERYNQDLKQKRELLLLIVTEHGIGNEKPLGIVALRDVKNALID